MKGRNTVDGTAMGVCGLLCEKCRKFLRKDCTGCRPNDTCRMPGCAYSKGLKLCFDCKDFPCDKCEALFQKKWLEFAGSDEVVG
jgi:hypothetical protein